MCFLISDHASQAFELLVHTQRHLKRLSCPQLIAKLCSTPANTAVSGAFN